MALQSTRYLAIERPTGSRLLGVPTASATASATPGNSTQFVQTAATFSGSTTTTSTVITFLVGVPVGHTLIVGFTRTMSTIVDSRSNTYTIDFNQTGTNVSAGLASTNVTTAIQPGDTITITHGNLGGRAAVVLQYTGLLTSTYIDSAGFGGVADNVGGTSGSVTGAGATTTPTDLIIGMFGLDNNISNPVAGAGYTMRGTATSTSTLRTTAMEEATVVKTGTQTATMSWTGTLLNGAYIVAAYKASPAGGVPAITILAPAASATASVTNVTTSFGLVAVAAVATSTFGPDWGGAYCNAAELDPRSIGAGIAGGDLWGVHATTDYGANWGPRMRKLGAVDHTLGNQNIYMRSVTAASVKNPGRFYHITGALKTAYGNGWFGWTEGLATPIHKSADGTRHGGTLQAGTSTWGKSDPGNHHPRASGHLIAVDYDSNTTTEYIYACLNTGAGVACISRSTDGGDSWTDIWTGTTGTTGAADIPEGAWRCIEVFDSDADGICDSIMFVNYRDTSQDATSPTGSRVKLLTAGSASIRTATSNAQLTTTTITAPAVVEHFSAIPGSGKPKAGGLVAFCGRDGVYTTNVTGITWTKQSGTFFNSSYVSAGDATSSTNIVAGCANVNGQTAGANTIAVYNGSWSWVTTGTLSHNTTGQISSIPWGTSLEEWLVATTAPTFNNRLGGTSFDAQQVSLGRLDPNTILVCGSAGAWLTRDLGAHWRPATRGLNGGVCTGVKCSQTLDGTVYANNIDYGFWKSTDNAISGVRSTSDPNPGAYLTANEGSILTDTQGHTYQLTLGTSSTDTTLTKDGVDIADDYLRAGTIAVQAWDITPGGVIVIGQYEGPVMVMTPSTGFTGFAAAQVPQPTLVSDPNLKPALITAAASVPVPLITETSLVPAPSGAAAAATTATVTISISLLIPAPASATASSSAIVVVGGIQTAQGTAAASCPAPSLKTTLLPPVAAATGSVPLVVVKITLLPPSPTATASAPTPLVTDLLVAAAATAAASAPAPKVLTTMLPAAAAATASAPLPTNAFTAFFTALVAPAQATASAGASLPLTAHFIGWKTKPIAPQVTAFGKGVTTLSVTGSFNFQTAPPVPATYLSIDSIHRYNNQVFQHNGSWQPLTYEHISSTGVAQTFTYLSADSILVSIVENRHRYFAVSISEQAPVISPTPIIAGQAYRLDLVADCSTPFWTVRWKLNLVDQPEVVSNRAEYYARASSASNWRQLTLNPDASPERNQFEVIGYTYDQSGTYPLP